MQHASARQLVARLLAGEGFGERAVALVQAGRLHDRSDCPEELRRRVLDRCLAEPVDPAAPYAHPLNQQPVPAEPVDLCAQLAPALVAHPADPATGVAALWSLAQLWPHVGADERPQLRSRLLNGLAGRKAEPAAVLTAFQLREWQKQVPTSYGTQAASAASLRGILEADEALPAYLLLAEHLGAAVDVQTLCWVLGSLTVQLIQSCHDRSGRLATLLQGFTACERLADLVPVEVLVTVLSQLNHQLWWLRAHGGLRPIRTSLDQAQRPYVPALLGGDITMAQRAARALVGQHPVQFWADSWQVVGDHLLGEGRSLARILAMIDAAHWRAGEGLVSGDDAAALATVLADVLWQRQQTVPN